MLLWLVFLPVIGGFIGWLCHVFLQRIMTSTDIQLRWQRLPMMIALITILITFILVIILWADASSSLEQSPNWIKEVNIDWIPLLGIHFHLVLDGLSLIVISSTLFIVLLVIVYSLSLIHI